MKACPTCQRTYADEALTFCLVDGSILSAPYDPHETLHLPATRITDPIHAQPPPPSTIQSPQALPFYPEKPQSELKEKRGGKSWMWFGIAMSLVSLAAVGVLISFILSGKDRVAGNQSNTNVANTNARPTASPTATPGVGAGDPHNKPQSIKGMDNC